MGPDAMILVFWMLSFKPAFSLSSFTFIKSPLLGLDPEASGGEGGGRGDRDGEYMYIQGWFMSVYDKNHYNIVK